MEHDVVESIEVSPQRQENKEQCPRQYPVFHWVANDDKPEDKEEANDGSEVDRSAGEGFVPPISVGTKGRSDLRTMLLQLLIQLGIAVQSARTAAAIGVGDERREQLSDAIAPLESVVFVQAAGYFLARSRRRCQLRSPTDGVLSQVPHGVHALRIRQDGYQHTYRHHCRRLAQLGKSLRSDLYKSVACIDEEAEKYEVIGDLDVSVANGKCYSQEEKCRSPQPFSSEKQCHSRQNDGHIGDHIRLCDVSCLNDNDVV